MATAQPTLFDIQYTTAKNPKKKHLKSGLTDWAERTRIFHAKKPQVYRRLVELAREIRKKWPARKVGIELLINKVRWEFSFDRTDSGEEFKINQNFARTYALMIEENEPDLAGMFEFRRLAKDRKKQG